MKISIDNHYIFYTMAKRRFYTSSFKLAIFEYAEKNGNRPASRKFGVDEKSVCEWRSSKLKL